MGTELMQVCIKEDNDEFPPVPPGFESFTSFSLKTVDDTEQQVSKNMFDGLPPGSASELQSVRIETKSGVSDAGKIKRSLRRRPSRSYGQYDYSSEDESGSERLNQNFLAKHRLPRGVIRGCSACDNCQKVTARWHPEDARRPDIQDAPVFYPSEEDFEDTLKYIAKIRPIAEPYGICRIVPPRTWKPPCLLKDKGIWDCSKFATRVQRVDKLQNRDSLRKMALLHNQMRRKRKRCSRTGADCLTGRRGSGDDGFQDAETFGFEPGPEFTLETFQKYADDFKAQYFSKNEIVGHTIGNFASLKEHWEPSVENIEGEYWRMVEKPSEEIEVLYGADLETGVFGSGFPNKSFQNHSTSEDQYIKSGWNLNNFPRLHGSVLSYESSDISGVLVPWLYIGMCFSSFCWHVEDHHLYSLNYMHWGSPKLWYGVPGSDACRLEEAMRKHLPDLFEEQPDLLHKLVTQLSPSILKSEGVPVYRCVQNPGEFVLTFPRAYHSGFNCGFNCAEAVNVAPIDWLPHGQIAINLYCEQGRKTSISHDKLLLGAAREAVRAHWELNLLKKNTSDNLKWRDVCGKDGILVKALKTRVEMERMRREFLCSSQAMKMDTDFDATSERECCVCLFDLHLSAAGCHCSPDKYACLNHAKQLCPCAWGDKFFLFRYDITELDILVEALEGKLSAIYRWARLDLGLALSSYVTKENDDNFSQSSEGAVHEEEDSKSLLVSLENAAIIKYSKESPANSTVIFGKTFSQGGKTLGTALPLKVKKESSVSDSSPCEVHLTNICLESKKEHILLASGSRNSSCHLSEGNASSMVNSVRDEAVLKANLAINPDNVIYLSDDEDDEPKVPVSARSKETSDAKASELSERQAVPDNKLNLSNHIKDPLLTTAVINAKLMGEKASCSLPDGGSSHPVHMKEEPREYCGYVESKPQNPSFCVSSHEADCGGDKNNHPNDSSKSLHHEPITKTDSQHPQPCGSENPGSKITNSAEHCKSLTGNTSSNQNNVDRSYRQKGPRIAKLVRRINCMVEPLEFGVVLSGNLWCNSQAIFPKGYRSRVRYMSVLDPTDTCYYVSEVLDAGKAGPLFMVSLEQSPKEVFVHSSASRCWEMVRERVNLEISRQHKLGRPNLPPLQPPGSLEGFEMFGFTSPAIVQAIEAMDRNRVCSEYWDSRPYSRPQVQIPQTLWSNDPRRNSGDASEKRSEQGGSQIHRMATGVESILRSLLKKANVEELNSLYSVLNDNGSTGGLALVTQVLGEEIHNRPR